MTRHVKDTLKSPLQLKITDNKKPCLETGQGFRNQAFIYFLKFLLEELQN
jgi:hypothetical protein